jgi:hypothetical protein
MRSGPPLVLALMLTPLACSSESTGSTSSSTTGGSGGPSKTAPEGAINMEVYTTPEQSCPLGNVHIDMGNSKVSPLVLVTEGFEGASVACSVVPDFKGNWVATGSLQKGALSFTFKDLTTGGQSATGTIVIKDPLGKDTYTSDPKSPCVFQFAPGSGQGVENGKLWIQFDCSTLVSDADKSKTCSSRYGYLFVDRCATK